MGVGLSPPRNCIVLVGMLFFNRIRLHGPYSLISASCRQYSQPQFTAFNTPAVTAKRQYSIAVSRNSHIRITVAAVNLCALINSSDVS